MSAKFRDRIDFAYISKYSHAVGYMKMYYGIKDTTHFLLETTQGEVISYTGDVRIEKIVKWLEPYARKEKIVRE
jgi:hypothetical protein